MFLIYCDNQFREIYHSYHTCERRSTTLNASSERFFFRMYGKNGIFRGTDCRNKLRTHFNPENLSGLKLNLKKDSISYIKPYFKMAWELQADSYNTNAMLTSNSIRKLSDTMIKEKIIKDKSLLIDCGSSFGSLILPLVNLCISEKREVQRAFHCCMYRVRDAGKLTLLFYNYINKIALLICQKN